MKRNIIQHFSVALSKGSATRSPRPSPVSTPSEDPWTGYITLQYSAVQHRTVEHHTILYTTIQDKKTK